MLSKRIPMTETLVVRIRNWSLPPGTKRPWITSLATIMLDVMSWTAAVEMAAAMTPMSTNTENHEGRYLVTIICTILSASLPETGGTRVPGM